VGNFFGSLQAAEDLKNFRLVESCVVDKLDASVWLPGYTSHQDALKPLCQHTERTRSIIKTGHCMQAHRAIGGYQF